MSLTVFVILQHVPPRKTDAVLVLALLRRRYEGCANKHSQTLAKHPRRHYLKRSKQCPLQKAPFICQINQVIEHLGSWWTENKTFQNNCQARFFEA
jgi:hypothetical protein